MKMCRFLLLFEVLGRTGLHTYIHFQKTHFFSHVHFCSIPLHTVPLTLCFSYRVRHLASVQSFVRIAHAHYLTGRM